VRLGVGIIFVQNILVCLRRLVEFVLLPEMIGAVEEIRYALIRRFRQSGRRTARTARPVRRAVNRLNITAAHLAFQYRHNMFSSINMFVYR
jgi:hypothetical protein